MPGELKKLRMGLASDGITPLRDVLRHGPLTKLAEELDGMPDILIGFQTTHLRGLDASALSKDASLLHLAVEHDSADAVSLIIDRAVRFFEAGVHDLIDYTVDPPSPRLLNEFSSLVSTPLEYALNLGANEEIILAFYSAREHLRTNYDWKKVALKNGLPQILSRMIQCGELNKTDLCSPDLVVEIASRADSSLLEFVFGLACDLHIDEERASIIISSLSNRSKQKAISTLKVLHRNKSKISGVDWLAVAESYRDSGIFRQILSDDVSIMPDVARLLIGYNEIALLDNILEGGGLPQAVKANLLRIAIELDSIEALQSISRLVTVDSEAIDDISAQLAGTHPVLIERAHGFSESLTPSFLRELVQEGRAATLEVLLDGVNPFEADDPEGRELLKLACVELDKVKIEDVATPSQLTTAVSELVQRSTILSLVWQKGCPFEASDMQTCLTLFTAGLVSNDKLADTAFQLLLDLSTDFDEGQLLRRAALAGNRKYSEKLLASGANPNQRSQERRTPLHAAAIRGCPDLVSMLLAGGALGFDDIHGNFPLHFAILAGSLDTVKLLGSAVSAVLENRSGLSPLALARAQSRKDLMLACAGFEVATVPSPVWTDAFVGWCIAIALDIIERPRDGGQVYLQVCADSLFEIGRHAIESLRDADDARSQFVSAVRGQYEGLGVGYLKTIGEIYFGELPAGLPIVYLSTLAAAEIEETQGNKLHEQVGLLLGDWGYRQDILKSCWVATRHWMQTRGLILAWPEKEVQNRPNVAPPIHHALWRRNELEDLRECLDSQERYPDLDSILRMRGIILSVRNRLPIRAQIQLDSADDDRLRAMTEMAVDYLREPPIGSARHRAYLSRQVRRTIWGRLALSYDSAEDTVQWTWDIDYSDGSPETVSIGGVSVEGFGGRYKPVWLSSPSDLTTIEAFAPNTEVQIRLERPAQVAITLVRNERCFVSGPLAVGPSCMVLVPAALKEEVESNLLPAIKGGYLPRLADGAPDGYELLGPFRLESPPAGIGTLDFSSDIKIVVESGLEVTKDVLLSGVPANLLITGMNMGDIPCWIEAGAPPYEASRSLTEHGLIVPVPRIAEGPLRLCLGETEIYSCRVVRSAFTGARKLQDTPRHRALLPEGCWVVIGARQDEIAVVQGGRRRRLFDFDFEPMWMIGTQVIPLTNQIKQPVHGTDIKRVQKWRESVRTTSLIPKPLFRGRTPTRAAWDSYVTAAKEQ